MGPSKTKSHGTSFGILSAVFTCAGGMEKSLRLENLTRERNNRRYRHHTRSLESIPTVPLIGHCNDDDVVFTGTGKPVRKPTGRELEKLKPRYPTSGGLRESSFRRPLERIGGPQISPTRQELWPAARAPIFSANSFEPCEYWHRLGISPCDLILRIRNSPLSGRRGPEGPPRCPPKKCGAQRLTARVPGGRTRR